MYQVDGDGFVGDAVLINDTSSQHKLSITFDG